MPVGAGSFSAPILAVSYLTGAAWREQVERVGAARCTGLRLCSASAADWKGRHVSALCQVSRSVS